MILNVPDSIANRSIHRLAYSENGILRASAVIRTDHRSFIPSTMVLAEGGHAIFRFACNYIVLGAQWSAKGGQAIIDMLLAFIDILIGQEDYLRGMYT